jgi:hypothetical protein
MADELNVETAEHQARLEKDAQDRAAIEVAEGVSVPRAVVARGAFVAMSERAKPFLQRYGHDDLSSFLGAVGSNSNLAREVIADLIEERFGEQPAPAPEPASAPVSDPALAELQKELASARDVLKGYDTKVDGLEAQITEAQKQSTEFEASAKTAGESAVAAWAKVTEAEGEVEEWKTKLTAALEHSDTINAAFGEYKRLHPEAGEVDKPAPEPEQADTAAKPEGEHAA